jgi:hypothetical protein
MPNKRARTLTSSPFSIRKPGGALGSSHPLDAIIDLWYNMPGMTSLSPILAITMGDAAGVGPEIIALALAREEMYHLKREYI